MESTSKPGRIQCSRKSFTLLRKQMPELELMMRGKIDVKGKGEMVTYWVNPDSVQNVSLSNLFPEKKPVVRKESREKAAASSRGSGNDDDMNNTRRSRSTHTVREEGGYQNKGPFLSSEDNRSNHSQFLDFLREQLMEENSDNDSFAL